MARRQISRVLCALVVLFCTTNQALAQPAEAPAVSVEDGPAYKSAETAEEVAPNEVAPNEVAPEETQNEVAQEDALSESNSESEPELEASDEFEEVSEAEVSFRYEVEAIRFVGNTRTKESVLRRHLPFAEGSNIGSDGESLRELELSLRSTGWFSSVRVVLKKGTKRGQVVLFVFLQERLTISVTQLTFGVSEGLNDSSDLSALSAYLGIELQENNLFGTGTRLGLGALLSSRQQGGRIWFEVPRLVGGVSFDLEFYLASSRQFFGQDPLVSAFCSTGEDCRELSAENAVVEYLRTGLSLGASRSFKSNFTWRLQWRFDYLNADSLPLAASERRGTEVRPIDFAIDSGKSWVSELRFTLDYDVRNDPALPTRGSFVRFQADASTRIIGSTYDFLRLSVLVRQWVKLPPKHSFRFSGFVGITLGDAPFFKKFHSSDLSDLIPSRFMEMQLDNRAPPNFLGTAIEGRRAEAFGARLDVEYAYALYTGTKFLRSLRGYINFGVYAVSSLQDLRVAVPGFGGGRAVPIDLTMDLGLRFDTKIGVFQLGFSNFLGFVTL